MFRVRFGRACPMWVLLLCSGIASAQEALPACEYLYVVHCDCTSNADVLLLFRQAIMKTLQESAFLPAGYPAPCRTRLEPVAERPGESVIRCDQSDTADKEATGIILDGGGNFVRLSVLDYPDTQPYLFEVYLAWQKAPSRFKAADRYRQARVVVHFPNLEGTRYPALIELIAKGLQAAGAGVLKR